ncbi:MAG: peptidylprolyl isomerase [Terracidiphilus sp.]|jgi:peptidyl-prolyl cis-trans isomerase SurA
MTFRLLRISAAAVLGMALLAAGSLARGQENQPESPYGGTTVEDIIARVNDQIITQSDYNRALGEMNHEGQQRGESMQAMATARRDLLRNLIDQQLWLSKGKELSITGETELIKRLDEIRKQYNLESLEDLEKAAKEQGVSFEDFKANIRNQIITQEVMRRQVGEHIEMTPGEVERYYGEHKQDYAQPESVRLSEILISTGQGGSDDPAKVAAAKAKADDIEARLHSGGDFAQLARSFSDGTTAASGGDLGQYKRGQLGKLLEDKTFVLDTGQYTEPILTRQGYIILKVVQHTPGGPRPFKEVEQEVEQAYYVSKMEPAIRDYLSRMRDEAFIQVKQGYVDTGATPTETHSTISFSAYVPPAPKKKAKVERTRFRESTRDYRQKRGAAPAPAQAPAEAAAPAAATAAAAPPAAAPVSAKKKHHKKSKEEAATQKPGKKEKIRFGQAPRATLPSATNNANTENAGALPETASNEEQPANPLEPTAPTKKTRFSQRAKTPKTAKPSREALKEARAPAAPDAAEVADRQTQSAPLGIAGDTSNKKKKKAANAAAEKTRLANKKKSQEESEPKPVQQPTPIAPVPGAPAPADHPTAPQSPPDSQPTGQ